MPLPPETPDAEALLRLEGQWASLIRDQIGTQDQTEMRRGVGSCCGQGRVVFSRNPPSCGRGDYDRRPFATEQHEADKVCRKERNIRTLNVWSKLPHTSARIDRIKLEWDGGVVFCMHLCTSSS